MFRRMPTFLSLSFAATLGLFALTSVLTAQPPATPAPPAPAPADATGIKRTQEENLKLFKRFAEEVLRLAQKWEKSDNADDKERAKSLRAALKLIEERGVEKLFKELIEGVAAKNLTGTDFNKIFANDAKLLKALEEILTILDTEDEAAAIKEQIKKLEALIAEAKRIKRDQENILARTNGKGDPDKIANAQGRLAKETQDLANAMAKGANPDAKGNPNGSGKEDPKSENKAEPKPGDNTGEAKPDTKENKTEAKPGAGMGDPKGGEPKPGSKGMGDPKDGGDKPAPKDGASAGGDPKPGEPNAKPMDPMGGAAKPMAGDGKPQGAGKGDAKPSAGQPGGDAKPMGGEGMGGMGQPSPGGSKGGGQSGQPGGSPPPPGGQPKDPAQDNVQQAVPPQQGAQEDIKNKKPDDATKKQDEAIKALERAIAELEKRLKQLREKELAKLLANLEERVNRMLRMQIEVRESTIVIDRGIQASNGKPNTADIQKSQGEADKESLIVAEAEKALKLMEGEGTAVVFAGVLKEVKGDMEAIQKRLNAARVGSDTQQIEQDVIDQLKMMLEALKKAKQDLENKPSDPKPNDPNAQQQKQKLIDLLNELKLIKALQEQVNKRTIMHNKQDPGEQAKDPLVQEELKQLGDRQKVLQEMLHKIATQANQ